MSSHEQDVAVSGKAGGLDAPEARSSRSNFARYAAQRTGLLVAFLMIGFIIGITYRYFMNLRPRGIWRTIFAAACTGLALRWRSGRCRPGLLRKRGPLSAQLSSDYPLPAKSSSGLW